MFLIGIAVSLLGVLATMTFKHIALTTLLSPAAILMYIFAIAAVLTATQSFDVFFRGFKAAIFSKEIVSEELRGKSASLFRLLSKVTGFTALLGLIVGLMATLQGMDMYDTVMLRHALTAALVVPLIGILLIVAVFEPVVFIMKKRHNTERTIQN